MIEVVKHKLFYDIPAALTVSAIRKHFKDNCVPCSKASMSQKPLPKVSSRVYRVGECCSLDIKEWTEPDFFVTKTPSMLSILVLDIQRHFFSRVNQI